MFLQQHCGRLACLHACVWIKKDSKPFTLQVPCDPNTRSINMAKKGAKKAAAEAPAPKKATTISANVDMQFSDLVGMLLQICICSSQHFFLHHTLNAALWTKSHLRLFPTETGVRYFVKSFVLCAEGHRHPQQGWVAARADYWPLKANWADARKK